MGFNNQGDQTGRPGGSRGVEVEGDPRMVSRRDDMHRGDLQERREADLRQGSIASGPLAYFQFEPGWEH